MALKSGKNRERPVIGLLERLAFDESGATAVEYSLIAVFVSIAAITGMKALGLELVTLFTDISSVLDYGLAKVGL